MSDRHPYIRVASDFTRGAAALTRRVRGLCLLIYSDRRTGDLIRDARRVRSEANDLVTIAVLTERTEGATWDQIAAALGETVTWTREHYAPIEARFRRGEHPTEPPSVARAQVHRMHG